MERKRIQKVMKSFNERIADISYHLQTLNTPEFSSEVQEAVEKKNKNLLMKICRKAKVPTIYLGPVMSVLFSVSPNQKWPELI